MSYFLNMDLMVLFFLLGVFASWIKSDLEVPSSISKFLSIFLLLSLGIKGGHELRMAGEMSGFWVTLCLALGSCILIPYYMFYILKRRLGPSNAAALAACYGSVSAITFIAARGFLENQAVDHSKYMVAIMALMEIPAIVVALYFVGQAQGAHYSLKKILSKNSVVLLIGGFLIGLLLNEPSWNSIKLVVKDAFKGILIFFLLDLGISAQKQLSEAWKFKFEAVVVAFLVPLLNGSTALVIAKFLGLSMGDQVILAALVGSASYIAAPAAIRSSLQDANPSLYLALPLALTFPMNILFGIPYYFTLATWISQIF